MSALLVLQLVTRQQLLNTGIFAQLVTTAMQGLVQKKSHALSELIIQVLLENILLTAFHAQLDTTPQALAKRHERNAELEQLQLRVLQFVLVKENIDGGNLKRIHVNARKLILVVAQNTTSSLRLGNMTL